MKKTNKQIAKLRVQLEQSKVTTKRTSSGGGGAWHKYYAGYTRSFVEQTLLGLGYRDDWTVLDPWNGSGTTTSTACALGCNAIGIDINPVTAIISSARNCNVDDVIHCAGLIEEIVSLSYRVQVRLSDDDPLLDWFSSSLAVRYRCLERALLSILASKNGQLIQAATQVPPPLASFFLISLVEAAKQLAKFRVTSNPTWAQPLEQVKAVAEELDVSFSGQVMKHMGGIEDEQRNRGKGVAEIIINDSRVLPIKDESVDAVISSPPYCTRIDYFKATSFELAAIGVSGQSQFLKDLRSNAMGTNLIRTDGARSADFPSSVNDVLERIRTHQSHSSGSYYYKYYNQYFKDAMCSLMEIKRVLKPRAPCVLVVQDSYYKEIHVPLGQLFADMALHLGMDSGIALRIPVKKVFSSLNTSSAKYSRNRVYSEDVVAAFNGGNV
ncbi:hypothetical protein ACTVWX_18225 [Pseudomonas aeruginosa]